MLALGSGFIPNIDGQGDCKRRASVLVIVCRNGAKMLLNNAIGNVQAQPGSLADIFGRKERIEQPVQVLFGDTMAMIDEIDAD